MLSPSLVQSGRPASWPPISSSLSRLITTPFLALLPRLRLVSIRPGYHTSLVCPVPGRLADRDRFRQPAPPHPPHGRARAARGRPHRLRRLADATALRERDGRAQRRPLGRRHIRFVTYGGTIGHR